jgi:hypothetical protein
VLLDFDIEVLILKQKANFDRTKICLFARVSQALSARGAVSRDTGFF